MHRDPEARKAYAAKWREEHREQQREYHRNYERKWKKRPGVRKRIRQHAAEREHDKTMLYRYGVSLAQVLDMVKNQDNKCAICNIDFTPQDKLVVDHNHGTDAVRGVTHNNCNSMLGMAHENPEVLRAAANYLEKHNVSTAVA